MNIGTVTTLTQTKQKTQKLNWPRTRLTSSLCELRRTSRIALRPASTHERTQTKTSNLFRQDLQDKHDLGSIFSFRKKLKMVSSASAELQRPVIKFCLAIPQACVPYSHRRTSLPQAMAPWAWPSGTCPPGLIRSILLILSKKIPLLLVFDFFREAEPPFQPCL